MSALAAFHQTMVAAGLRNGDWRLDRTSRPGQLGAILKTPGAIYRALHSARNLADAGFAITIIRNDADQVTGGAIWPISPDSEAGKDAP